MIETAMRVPLHASTLGEEEIEAVVRVLRSGQVTMGEVVRQFEAAFATRTGFRHAVMVNSGSSANLLAVSVLADFGLWGSGGSIVVPALTWPTAVWPIIQRGLRPIIMDVDRATWCLDEEAALGSKRPVDGSLPVAAYGNAGSWSGSSLPMIFDCCEALGTTREGIQVGKDAAIATFSLYFSHHMTTIEGGVCCTDRDDLDRFLRVQRSHGWIRDLEPTAKLRHVSRHPGIDPWFLFVDCGYNVRPMEIQAAIGLIQLQKLDGFLSTRSRNWDFLHHAVGQWGDLFEFQRPPTGVRPAWFGFNCLVRESARFTRDDLRRFLATKGIETRPVLAGNIARQPGLQRHDHAVWGSLTQANRIMDRALSIGIHPGLTEEDLGHVADAFKRFVEGGERT